MQQRKDFSIEPGRGVYDARRAAALSGVPRSTLHYWARTGLYRPSVSPEPRVRLWSWADLLALRAIDWFRRSKGADQPPRVSIRRIRQALEQLDERQLSRQELYHIVAVSAAGDLYITVGEHPVRAEPGMQVAWEEFIPLVRPYSWGPDLLEPRPRLRIIPGKLHGEPHLAGTRIPSAAVYALYMNGYDIDQIHAMYPTASLEALIDAIDLERSLSERAA